MKRKSTAALAALLGALVAVGPVLAADRGDEARDSPRVAPHLALYDPSVPALETYRDWPGPAELERFYGLPWSRLPFSRAELFGHPVLLVLTVDWNRSAQRLATEVLVDPETLRVLNQGYVTIVVNADLRPDIRERYQTGAWPVMAWLLPNGKPMLSQVNDMNEAQPIVTSEIDAEALQFLLREGIKYWRKWPDVLRNAGDAWAEDEGPVPPEAGMAEAIASDGMARWLLGSADREEGGFGAGAKFLVTSLDEYAALRATRSLPALRRHSRLTLDRLVASPLIDSREGGMHRLAAGPSYTELEYEKLLVGNAHLLRELVFSLRGEPSATLEEVLAKTAAYLMKTLGRPEGGFFQAQAADPSSEDGGDYWRGRRRGEPPPVNELVLSGPNATVGAALIRAGLWLDDPEVVEAGRAALDLVLERGYRAGRGVGHAIAPMQDPRTYLTTQADVALAFLDAYETTGDPAFLGAARDIAEFAGRNLVAPGRKVFHDYLPDSQPIGLLANERRPLRPNVRMARALLRLALHDADAEDRERAIEILEHFCGNLGSYGVHGVEAALAIEEAIGDPLLVRVSGPPGDARTESLRRAAVNAGWGFTVLLAGEASGPPRAELERAGKTLRVGDAAELPGAVAELVGGEER